MSPLLLSIPTERELLIAWLEKKITGLELGQLVAELSVVHGVNELTDLQDVCGSNLSAVFNYGLSALSGEQLTSLLTNPLLLLDLQEQAFINGSSYWSQLASDGPAGQVAMALQPGILQSIFRLESKTLNGATGTTSPEMFVPAAAVLAGSLPHDTSNVMPTSRVNLPSRNSNLASRNWKVLVLGFVSVCTAALILFAARNSFPVQTPVWGFDRPGALTMQIPESEFFQHLSGAGSDWFKKRPVTANELEQRLTEFSHGCQTLIDAPLPQLDEHSREWLRGKCQNWKNALDKNRLVLNQQPERFEEILGESDAVVNRMVAVLKAGPDAA